MFNRARNMIALLAIVVVAASLWSLWPVRPVASQDIANRTLIFAASYSQAPNEKMLFSASNTTDTEIIITVVVTDEAGDDFLVERDVPVQPHATHFTNVFPIVGAEDRRGGRITFFLPSRPSRPSRPFLPCGFKMTATCTNIDLLTGRTLACYPCTAITDPCP